MVSPTGQSDRIRKRRDRKKGRARKVALRNKGTTPPFPIHPPDAKG